ncbi:hypothetical protein [Butyrivibrio sp. LC3010]|uniref:hypothetical protein n=1 Tax=Butyrivibrio sp. LC3010 TaxID=1280680 RepID=UPI0003FF8E1E|nr:hypothetical protein [Butyrivibrio sp. LC3010]
MWFLIPISFFITAALLAVKFKESICDTIAIAGAIQILTLYVLAMFRGLKLVYLTSAFTIVIFAVLILADFLYKKTSPEKRKIVYINRNRRVLSRSLRAVTKPEVFVFVLILAAITYLTRNQIFTWWDDINFWSSDAKQLFYLNGFPGKYGNVSPEFGDYPPVTSLFKWVFLQISASKYRESLQFAGYYALNAVFLMPLVKPVKGWMAAPATILVMLVPGIVNGIIFYGTPADITMGIVYGALLYAIWDREGHRDIFYFGRIALYTSVILLTKSVGIEWAIFALFFYFEVNNIRNIGMLLKTAAFSGVFYGSWLIFCLINRRVAKATGLGIKMVGGAYAVPANALEKAKYFLLGMWTMPMHADHNFTFDLSIGAMIIIIFVALFIVIKNRMIDEELSKGMVRFFVISCIFTYAIIFIAHISLFQAENQYLDAFAMTNSASRYGAPFTLGSIYLLLGIILDRAGIQIADRGNLFADKYRKEIIYIMAAAFILLTTDYVGSYNCLWGYKNKLSENEAYNAAMLDDGGHRFMESVYGHRNLWGHRVLNLRSGNVNHWVHDAYISKAVSPVPAVYDTLTGAEDATAIKDMIKRSHAEYVFTESLTENDPAQGSDNISENDENAIRSSFNELTADGEFEFWKIYKVEEKDGDITLSSVYLY